MVGHRSQSLVGNRSLLARRRAILKRCPDRPRPLTTQQRQMKCCVRGCDVGTLRSDIHYPVVVNGAVRPYCRQHACKNLHGFAQVEADYLNLGRTLAELVKSQVITLKEAKKMY